MRVNGQDAPSTLPDAVTGSGTVTGTARVARTAGTLLPMLLPGDVAVIDQVDLDQDTATALVDAGVSAVVNAAAMISGHYGNLGPEVLAEAGVVLVDRVGPTGLARIQDDQRVRVRDGVVYDVQGSAEGEVLATGRVVDLDWVHREMEQPHPGLHRKLGELAEATGQLLQEEPVLLGSRGLPELLTKVSGRPVVVVAAADHAGLKSIGPYVREQAPVVFAVGAAADDLVGLSWVPDVVLVTAGDPDTVPAPDALRVASDVVLVAALGSGLAEQATLEAVVGAPAIVETSLTAEDLALLLAARNDASLVIGVGLPDRLERLMDGTPSVGSLAARLELGDRLVDARVVQTLYTGRPGALMIFTLVLAGLVALIAAIAITPVGQQWGNDVIDYFQGLT